MTRNIDDYKTGERISTPRGNFSVVTLSRAQMEAEGFGFHHDNDDYYIMTVNNTAYAVSKSNTAPASDEKDLSGALREYAAIVDGLAEEFNSNATIETVRIRHSELDFMDDDEIEELLKQAATKRNEKSEVKEMAMSLEDYREQVKSDLLDYARECWGYDHDITAETIIDDAWTADSVTGNGSGSYTFNTWQAQQNIADLIWDEELIDMFREFGTDHIPMEQGAEAIDVSIRCFLVGEFAEDVETLIDELNEGSAE